MSNHYDYMPKPEGWVPEPYPMPTSVEETSDAAVSVAEEKNAGNTDNANNPDGCDGTKATADSDNTGNTDTTSFEDTTPAEKTVSLISNVLSWIFVPLMIPVYGIILIFSLSILSLSAFHTKLTFTLVVFGVNFAFPLLMVVLLKKMGMVDDIGLNGRKERLIPYLITILCLAGTGWFLYFKGAPLWVAMFYAGGALAALINLIINFKWKISAHAAGIAGIVAMLIQITKEGFPMPGMTLWIVASILTAGLLCSARVWLGRHTLLQVLAGSAVGFLSVWSLSLI